MQSFRIRTIQEKMAELYGNAYTEYRKQWSDPDFVPENAPLHLDIDMRDACNQRCAMCHQLYRKRTNIKITKKILEKTLSEAAPAGLKSVNIGASCESLLEPELLLYTLELCQKYSIMDTFIHTNAILLTEELTEKLIQAGLKHLCISVDAATEKTYRQIRCTETFAQVETHIKNAAKIRGEQFFPEIRVSFCLTPINEHEKNAFYNKWKDTVDLIEFQDYREVENSLDSGKEKKPRNACKEGIKRVMLWPNGDIAACCMGWQGVTFGNILESSFTEIWQSERAKTIRTALSSGENLPEVCQMCLQGYSN